MKASTIPPSNQSHFKLCDHSHLDNVFASTSKADVPWCLRNALWNMGIGREEQGTVILATRVKAKAEIKFHAFLASCC